MPLKSHGELNGDIEAIIFILNLIELQLSLVIFDADITLDCSILRIERQNYAFDL